MRHGKLVYESSPALEGSVHFRKLVKKTSIRIIIVILSIYLYVLFYRFWKYFYRNTYRKKKTFPT